uniref:Outer dense fiber protein 3-like protein 2 n=1 Tax=Lygus hesperus TaxID=30085 RepID=A0A0A9YDS1_LYGHE
MRTTGYPWRAPPPNLYRLRPVLGYRNHDYTKKRAPAWSFVRYVAPPQPKPVVSMSPYQKKLMRQLQKMQGKKKKAHTWASQATFDTEGGSTRRFPNQKHNKRKKQQGKNKKRRFPGDESSSRKWEKPSDQGTSSKDKSKKLVVRRSTDSGQFLIAPDDMCDLCFPWAKPKPCPSSETESKSVKKLPKTSRSIVSNSAADDSHSGPEAHSFLVMQPGRFMEDMICDPHSGILLPSGKKIAVVERNLPKLPRPPKEENQFTTKERCYVKCPTKTSAHKNVSSKRIS